MTGDGVRRRRRGRIHWGWLRLLPLVLALALALVAVVHQVDASARDQARLSAAQQLASSPPSAVSSPPQVTAPPSSAIAATEAPPSPPPLALPPKAFAWPAAGLAVDVVPMAWTPGQTVDPPLDANNFDPVGHWLEGTGQSAALRPVVLAAHTCHVQVPLCNDSTFPFNRLSYAGWSAGQPATLTDASGTAVPCTLEDRRITDKSKAFTFPNDPCLVVVFSCSVENPDADIVLLTFRCGQCT
ncbi:hypothetical protein [Sinomonas gamaensis]|uniref:hypothetical protein n=1 Tax=Sinomonas gamaensis TaxID=2565624 RepID=UPI001485E6D7|nr:hypothetical protein [Sinomonas gamaensis]